jgi:hypothetical protein
MPPDRPSPRVAAGARRRGLRSGRNEIAEGHSRYDQVAQELRRDARFCVFIAYRKNVQNIPAPPASYGAAG